VVTVVGKAGFITSDTGKILELRSKHELAISTLHMSILWTVIQVNETVFIFKVTEG
jgi:hypothetical protein